MLIMIILDFACVHIICFLPKVIMPSKKSKASSSRASASEPAEFDKSKFVSLRAWNWYNTEIEKKTIILEKAMKINEGWDNSI